MVVDGGGTATVTPATFANGTKIAFADVNDSSYLLLWANTIGWVDGVSIDTDLAQQYA